jgi:hypothetical protein
MKINLLSEQFALGNWVYCQATYLQDCKLLLVYYKFS